jgi:hypothetical protein
MKKAALVLAFLLSGLIAVGYAQAAAIAVEASYIKDVKLDKTEMRYEYTVGIDVAVSTTAYFKIPIPFAVGSVIGVSWDSDSTDCTIWGAPADAIGQGDIRVIFRLNNADEDYAPDIPERQYRNRDTPEAYFLYVAVQNDDAVNAIADAKLALIFRK